MKTFFLILRFPIVFPIWFIMAFCWSLFFGKDGWEGAQELFDDMVLLK